MADFKYIMFHVNGQDIPIIFPDIVAHSDMARALQDLALRTRDVPYFEYPVSAGFVTLQVMTDTRGSETLKLEPRPEDEDIINTWPYSHGRAGGLAIARMIGVRFADMLLKRLQ